MKLNDAAGSGEVDKTEGGSTAGEAVGAGMYTSVDKTSAQDANSAGMSASVDIGTAGVLVDVPSSKGGTDGR